MQHTELDHLVVAAADLEQGAAWCRATLGVDSAPGGRHPLMSTHNRLLALGRAPGSTDGDGVYLEIVAIDPAAPRPGRVRWFGLDDPALQARLLSTGPELVGWAVRSQRLGEHHRALTDAGLQPGEVLAAQRDTPAGLLRWQIVIRDDGALVAEGAVPTLIERHGPHPASTLPAAAIRLRAAVVRGLPEPAAQGLGIRGVQRATDRGPVFEVELETPLGSRPLATTARR